MGIDHKSEGTEKRGIWVEGSPCGIVACFYLEFILICGVLVKGRHICWLSSHFSICKSLRFACMHHQNVNKQEAVTSEIYQIRLSINKSAHSFTVEKLPPAWLKREMTRYLAQARHKHFACVSEAMDDMLVLMQCILILAPHIATFSQGLWGTETMLPFNSSLCWPLF